MKTEASQSRKTSPVEDNAEIRLNKDEKILLAKTISEIVTTM